jgi:hydrophobe/amphiphile efflux-1 (HAE1) family protein
MFSVTFIKRPILASVISIIIVLTGLVSLYVLPIQEYPEVAPPTVVVSAVYTGGNARDVEENVIRPLETQINGVKGMIYMESTSAGDGTGTIKVYFEPGYDLDIAAVDVQNKVSVATPQLPPEVKQIGVTVQKQSPNIVCLVALTGNENYDAKFLSNFLDINVVDELKRIPGVDDALNLGQKMYSIRVWLNPNKMESLKVSALEIINAIKEQNKQAALGKIGSNPTNKDQNMVYIITTKSKLSKVDEFENIIVKAKSDGQKIYLKDVARVELGIEKYDWNVRFNKKPTGMIQINQIPGSNSLEIKKKVVEKMEELKARFPEGVNYLIPYDTTNYVSEAIKGVVESLRDALVLVILVIWLFLQSYRPTIIASIAIPVSLVGTFVFMIAFGFSINFLTLFGLILAIGIVVDDAILVVENVERIAHEKPNLSMAQVTKESMIQLIGPIIATTLVLAAVFLPVSMMPGITGTLYQQFALTISFAVIISALNALTISPALAAILMKRKKEGEKEMILYRYFNKGFDAVAKYYEILIRFFIKIRYLIVVFFVGLLYLTYYTFTHTPTGFAPEEDKGVMLGLVQLKSGTSLNRTTELMEEIEKRWVGTKGVKYVVAVDGFSLLSETMDSSAGAFFITLDHWEERKSDDLKWEAVRQNLMSKVANISDARIALFNVPAIPGIGLVGGFDFRLQDYMAGSMDRFVNFANQIIAKANADPRIKFAYTSFTPTTPSVEIEIDRDKAKTLGLKIDAIYNTLQAYLGSIYVNDFTKYGRIFKVYVQANKDFRDEKSDILKLYVKNNKGKMVPLSSIAKIKDVLGPQQITHYNIYRSITINGSPAEGRSSGEAMEAMEEIAKGLLPKSYGFEWSGMSLQEKIAGSTAVFVFAFALIVVYLVLAGQYESWVLPVMILISVPLVMLGALLAVRSVGIENNIFVQVGLVLLIGLSSKNAILIVEFAKELREQGQSIIEAAINAAKLRFRAILMTTFSFILGIIPLVLNDGAGATTQHSIGVGLLGGMGVATFVSTLFVPVVYVLLESLREKFVSVEEEVEKRRMLD